MYRKYQLRTLFFPKGKSGEKQRSARKRQTFSSLSCLSRMQWQQSPLCHFNPAMVAIVESIPTIHPFQTTFPKLPLRPSVHPPNCTNPEVSYFLFRVIEPAIMTHFGHGLLTQSNGGSAIDSNFDNTKYSITISRKRPSYRSSESESLI